MRHVANQRANCTFLVLFVPHSLLFLPDIESLQTHSFIAKRSRVLVSWLVIEITGIFLQLVDARSKLDKAVSLLDSVRAGKISDERREPRSLEGNKNTKHNHDEDSKRAAGARIPVRPNGASTSHPKPPAPDRIPEKPPKGKRLPGLCALHVVEIDPPEKRAMDSFVFNLPQKVLLLFTRICITCIALE